MLDIRFIRENPDLVQENAKNKGYDVDIAQLLKVDGEKKALQQKADELREKRNAISGQLKGGKPSDELIAEAKTIKDTLVGVEADLKTSETAYDELMSKIPNMMQADVPLGGEADSVEIKKWGEQGSGAIDH